MSKSAFIGTRVEPEFKQEIEAICDRLGLSVSQAITLFLKQMQHHQGLPFEVRVPSQTTVSAVRRANERRGLRTYDSPDDLHRDLGL